VLADGYSTFAGSGRWSSGYNLGLKATPTSLIDSSNYPDGQIQDDLPQAQSIGGAEKIAAGVRGACVRNGGGTVV